MSEGYNFLIEGENLESLNILTRTHRNRVNIIYIDPPYNRGKNDFMYEDNYIDTTDTFKHSKWLTFIETRLKIAYDLLTDDGVIFISIDDNEVANLKLLSDSIFGANNFISCMPRVTKKSGKSADYFSKNHDYVLIYVKEDSDIFLQKEHIDQNFRYEDEHVAKRGKYKLNQTLDYKSLGYVNSLDFPISINGRTYYPGSVSREEHLARKRNNPRNGYRWRWSKDLVDFGLKNDWIVVNENTNRVYTKTYLNAKIRKINNEYDIEYVKRTKPMSTLELTENIYSNDNARKELDKFNLDEKFEYPKPSSLIKRLIETYDDKNAIVLDFFAGSGTTAQAVLDLNESDGGNRQYIICTNNENNICDKITYPRLKLLSHKHASNLKHLYVEKLSIKNKFFLEYSDKLLDNIEHIIELSLGKEIHSPYKLFKSEDEFYNYIDNIDSHENKYIKHVYISNNILLEENVKQLILNKGIDLYIVPDYFYNDN